MKKFDQINVIPFIDIMLVLFAIVLATASFINQGVISVKPPESRTADALQESLPENRLISADADGTLYLDEREILLADLEKEISTWDSAQRVHLKLDAQTPFRHFVQLGDLLRARNITQVNLLVTPEAAKR